MLQTRDVRCRKRAYFPNRWHSLWLSLSGRMMMIGKGMVWSHLLAKIFTFSTPRMLLESMNIAGIEEVGEAPYAPPPTIQCYYNAHIEKQAPKCTHIPKRTDGLQNKYTLTHTDSETCEGNDARACVPLYPGWGRDQYRRIGREDMLCVWREGGGKEQ